MSEWEEEDADIPEADYYASVEDFPGEQDLEEDSTEGVRPSRIGAKPDRNQQSARPYQTSLENQTFAIEDLSAYIR